MIADDERQFAAIADSIAEHAATLRERLDELRALPVRGGEAAMDRDQQIRRLTAQLRTLSRYGVDLCLGRIVQDGDEVPIYIGRTGLTDRAGNRLLVDWRAPAAEPFFAATLAEPLGLASRRRYRWTLGRVNDYWDEAFTDDALAGSTALDDQSAFIAELGASRSAQMRDVLGTIQADQNAIVRAGSRGALVVDGGPGTGKTVVALHRAAYLLYADPRLGHHRGGVLFVGPTDAYLGYVADVLPSLGEEGVQACTLRHLVPEGAAATPERDPHVHALKSGNWVDDAIERAAAFYEETPTRGLDVETSWADVRLTTADWAEAFETPDPGTPHNDAREAIWEALVGILLDKHAPSTDDGPTRAALRRDLAANETLVGAFNRAWPLLNPADVVADLWSVPAFLRLCAPHLSPADVRALQRPDPTAWTDEDLPLLDAAYRRFDDPAAARRRRRREQQLDDEREYMSQVIDDLVAADDDGEGLVTQLKVSDMRERLTNEEALPQPPRDELAGPFAHVIVDEAQELTDAQWRMLLRRCPSGSMTIVGDRAQARGGFTESWRERLGRVGVLHAHEATLTINYRTPSEVMDEAARVITAAISDAAVPTSVRSSGVPVRRGARGELAAVLDEWLARNADGIACVIGDADQPSSGRVRSLDPVAAKGLEFDLVVLVEPDRWGDGVAGAVDRYVAMTRATRELVILGGRA